MLKKIYYPAVLVLAIFVGILMYCLYGTYEDYSVDYDIRKENAGKTNYEKAFGGIISYNTDGVSLLDYTGEQKWNLSYEMQNPTISCKKSYALIYDKQGTAIEILDKSGETSRINVSYPITLACVSESGRISVVMQRNDVAHVLTYDSVGNIVAEGEMHGGESGFPMALSLSNDGNHLVISVLHLAEADVKTDIIFYDFSEEGKKYEDNKAAVFTMVDEVVPVVDYMENNKVFVAGTNSIKLYSSSKTPEVTHEFFFDTDIKTVVYNDRYFAVVTEEKLETGEIVNVLKLYSSKGREKYSKQIDVNYSKCRIMENDEIFMTDGKTGVIYTKLGVKKFEGLFDGELSSMMPAGGLREYYLLTGGELLKVSLR